MLYGTAPNDGKFGGGTVFKLTPPSTQGNPWTETTLHSFGAFFDASAPSRGSLILDENGNPYGASAGGNNLVGAIYQLNLETWQEKVLYSFAGGTDAQFPVGLTGINGSYIGAARSGGTFGDGAIFKLSPPAEPGGNWVEIVILASQAVTMVGRRGLLP